MSLIKAYELHEKFDQASCNLLLKHQRDYDSEEFEVIQEYINRGSINKRNFVTVVYSYDPTGTI